MVETNTMFHVFRLYLEQGANSSSGNEEIAKAIELTETRAAPLGSFPAIFSQALALGTLSRRQVYNQVSIAC